MNCRGSISLEYLIILLSIGLSIGLVTSELQSALVTSYQGQVDALQRPVP